MGVLAAYVAMVRRRWWVLVPVALLVALAAGGLMRLEWWGGPPDSGARQLGRAASMKVLEDRVEDVPDEYDFGIGSSDFEPYVPDPLEEFPDDYSRHPVPPDVVECAAGGSSLPYEITDTAYGDEGVLEIVEVAVAPRFVDFLEDEHESDEAGNVFYGVAYAAESTGDDGIWYPTSSFRLVTDARVAYRSSEFSSSDYPEGLDPGDEGVGVVLFEVPAPIAKQPVTIMVGAELYTKREYRDAAEAGRCVRVVPTEVEVVGHSGLIEDDGVIR